MSESGSDSLNELVRAKLSIEEIGGDQLRLEIKQTHPIEIETFFDGDAASVAGFIMGFLGYEDWI